MVPRPDVRAAERDKTRRHPESPLQRAPLDAQARTSRRRVPRRGVQAGPPQERLRPLLLEGRMPPHPDVRAAERDKTRRHPESPLQRAPLDAQARTSRRRVPRRGVQAGPPQERLRPLLLEGRMPPRPDVRAAERDKTRRHPESPLQRAPLDAQARTSRRRVPRRGVQAGPPQERLRLLLLDGRMPPRPDVGAAERDETRRHSECPLQRAPLDAQAWTSRRRVPRHGVHEGQPQERPRLLLLEGRMPPSAQRGECPRMSPRRPSSQAKSNCWDSNRPSARYHS